MRLPSLLATLLVLGNTAVTAWGADLTRIDRTIAREPTYQSRPKYCLLVFGPQAKTRIWLVLDGDTLYVSRHGNGDLTAKGAQVVNRKPNTCYAVGAITEPDRGTKHAALSVTPQQDGSMVVALMAEGKYRQRSGRLRFAGRPQEAPVLHFNGPVSVRFTSAAAPPDRGQVGPAAAKLGSRERLLQQLGKKFPLPSARQQTKVVSLSAAVGTPGLGEGTFVTYKARDILGQPIVVEAAFPNQDARARPIRVKGFLQPDG
jgi:hypothetical protein